MRILRLREVDDFSRTGNQQTLELSFDSKSPKGALHPVHPQFDDYS